LYKGYIDFQSDVKDKCDNGTDDNSRSTLELTVSTSSASALVLDVIEESTASAMSDEPEHDESISSGLFVVEGSDEEKGWEFLDENKTLDEVMSHPYITWKHDLVLEMIWIIVKMLV
jgi:hypothetical protein